MTTLIAGFAPFPGAPFNPSGDLVEALHGRPDLLTVTLPVSWTRSWPILEEAIRNFKPRHVVLFGLHMKAERVRIELQAKNRRELGRKDAAGEFPAGPSIMEGPPGHKSVMPWSMVAESLRLVGLDFEWSTDAGGYLCNDTLYRLIQNAPGLGIETYGFVHVPMTDERVGDVIAGEADIPAIFNSVSGETLRAFALALVEALSAAGPAGNVDVA